MFGIAEQSKQLYVPDFKLWNDYYEKKKLNVQKVPEQQSQSKSSDEVKENSVVKLKFVSPITQTIDQAESVMKTDRQKNGKKVKLTKKARKPKKSSQSKKVQGRKQTKRNSSTFSYRKLKDIFSKGKK